MHLTLAWDNLGHFTVLADYYFPLLWTINSGFFSLPHQAATFLRADLLKPKIALYFLVSMIGLMFGLYYLLAGLGEIFCFNILFYAQFWHHLRQHYGILTWKKNTTLLKFLFHFIPITALFQIGNSGPHLFLGHLLWTFKTPTFLPYTLFLIFSVILLLNHFSYQNLAYLFLYLCCFFIITDFKFGLLLFSFIHNIQYFIFVFKFNKEKNKSYKFYTLYLSALFFVALITFVCNFLNDINRVFYTYFIVINMAFSFVHYFWDGIIWTKYWRNHFH